MRIAESESLRFVLYGAIAFPLCSALLSARWPRLAAVLGLSLVGLWATTCGVMAYEDPALEAWEWIPLLTLVGLLFGAVANSYLFRGIVALDEGEPTPETQERAGSAHQAADPQPPSPARPPDPWTILGIAPGASAHEIQRAFRARMSEYHPDKVATLGTELRELAEAKSKDITEAHAVLVSRGSRTSSQSTT